MIVGAGPRLSLVRRALPLLLFVELPLVVVAYVVVVALDPRYMADFHVFWQAGRDFAAGISPYPPLDAALLDQGHSFVYPAGSALAFVPMGLLPSGVAAALFMGLLLLAVPLTLAVLGVRDWRCYGVAFVWAPVLAVLGSGALTLFLALGLALAWRYRDRRAVAAVLIGAVIVTKLLLWPMLVWLLATRRWRTAAYALAGSIVVTIAAWAAIGFAGMRDYPKLVQMLADVESSDGYSLLAIAEVLAVPSEPVRLAAALIAALAVVLFARGEDGDRRAFSVAIGAALLVSPIVWLHYFALLIVPIALARPRLSPLWFAPIALWLVPMHSNGEVLRRIVFAVVLSGAVLAACVRRADGARSQAGGASATSSASTA